MQIAILVIFILAILFSVKFLKHRKVIVLDMEPALLKKILEDQVPFYQQLIENKKAEFEERTTMFLRQVKITGIKTKVEDLDRVLIAASATIPIFNFVGWQYRNLHEVLLYPGSFDHEYNQEGHGRNILGMVGGGAMNHIMILSQPELRQAFINNTGKENTAIHEFVVPKSIPIILDILFIYYFSLVKIIS